MLARDFLISPLAQPREANVPDVAWRLRSCERDTREWLAPRIAIHPEIQKAIPQICRNMNLNLGANQVPSRYIGSGIGCLTSKGGMS